MVSVHVFYSQTIRVDIKYADHDLPHFSFYFFYHMRRYILRFYVRFYVTSVNFPYP